MNILRPTNGNHLPLSRLWELSSAWVKKAIFCHLDHWIARLAARWRDLFSSCSSGESMGGSICFQV